MDLCQHPNTMRKCQVDAISSFQSRRHESESNLSLCTGAGKSRIIREITSYGDGRRIIVFPWLDLMNQYVDEHKDAYHCCVRYLATEGSLKGVQRLEESVGDLGNDWIIFTTYTSAPVLFKMIEATSDVSIDILCHDEAHRTERPDYKAALETVRSKIRHCVNLSATLPATLEPHYRYSLLRGIKDGVVRDFHMELFVCVDKERSETQLLIQIVEKLKTLHRQVKLLVYTAEANTDSEESSSVKTFMDRHKNGLEEQGWWIEGIKADTKDRKTVLRTFEVTREVSILVSCKTLSEGIDLKGANCMLPWDPSASIVENIQRIGRVLRLYKTTTGTVKKPHDQHPSTVFIPVFLEEARYKACEGREAIDAELCKDISEGSKGNFRPIVNVCAALKSELAEEDTELFNRLLHYPAEESRVTVERDLVECVAKHLKKDEEEVLEAVVSALGAEDAETIWDDHGAGEIAKALADTQGITLVIKELDEVEMFGEGETVVTVEKEEDSYKVVKGKAAAGNRAAVQKRIAQRMRCGFSDGCRILLGLEAIEGADAEGGMILTRLTTEVQDEDWEKRRLEWVAQYERLGRKPSCMSKDIDERRAGNWQQCQRQNYRKNLEKMKAERIGILNETPGWTWEEEDTWEPNRQNWIHQYEKYKRSPSTISKDIDEKKAGEWQSHQRTNYKNKESCMTSERINILNNTLGWTWENDYWDIGRLNWIVQFNKLQRNPSQSSKDINEKKAAKWQTLQRQNYQNKASCMTSDRINILNNTLGWTWEDNLWEEGRQNWIAQNKLQRNPSAISKDENEKKAGRWQSHQRNGYKNKESWMTSERINILNNTPGWMWEEEDTWELNRLHWISQRNRLGKKPSETSNDANEKRAGAWQSKQRQGLKKKTSWMTPERINILNNTPGWSWEGKDTKERIRHIPAEPHTQPAETHQRTPSQLEEFHKRFKTMNAATYKSTVTPEEFAEYHKVADTYDARDPPERQPIQKIANMLSKFNKPSYTAIDLGCGKNRLRSHESVSRMTWTSVDVHAVDETVQIADMSQLPFEDETYDIAILGRSLWARNHAVVLTETHRILKSGGRVIVCESFRRWLTEGTNTLLPALRDVGFEIVFEEGTSLTDEVKDVFQYIICRKV